MSPGVSSTRRLFEQAIELPASAREAWIDETCAGDSATASRLRELLRADEQVSGILDESLEALASNLDLATDEEPAERIGSHIGPYRLTAVLGSGGMGVVYRAERDAGDFAQIVALKLIRNEKLSDFARARFMQERNILARMQHPNIARLLDGGVDERGDPWFAMEFIEGAPLLHWCDERQLSVRERLRFFLDVCDAVEYAHSRLVIHRDIKPHNVMVGGNVVKLLDFGIAKLFDKDGAQGLATGPQARLLTPEYAAPEQVRAQDITTATDVHALGLLLYELLCGQRAFDTEHMTAHQIQNEVLERDPPSMSQRLRQARTKDSAQAAQIATCRSVDGRQLQRLLRGDLQHIVNKALRKEPGERYSGPRMLIDDVRRYLKNRPVFAANGAGMYRLRKFVQRNRVAVALGSLIVALLVTGTLAIAWEARQAQREAQVADTVRNFMIEIFSAASPYRTPGDKTPTAVDLLDRAAQRIETLDVEPQIRAYLYQALGQSYNGLSHYKEALDAFRKAKQAAAISEGEDSALAQQIDIKLAGLIYDQNGSNDEANALLDRVIAQQKPPSSENRDLIVSALNMRSFTERDLHRALAFAQEAVAAAEKLPAESSETKANAYMKLGFAYAKLRQDDKTISAYKQALDLRTHAANPQKSLIADVQVSLAEALMRTGQSFEAEVNLREATETLRQTLGEKHLNYADALESLGLACEENAHYAEAEAALKHALDIVEHEAGPNYWQTAQVLYSLARVKFALDEDAEALELNQRALAIFSKLYGEDNEMTLHGRGNIARIDFRQGNYAEAETTLRDVLQHKRKIGSSNTIFDMDYLGRTRRMLGHPDEAAELHKQADDIAKSQDGELSDYRLIALAELARDQRDLGNIEVARQYTQSALAGFEKTFPADHPYVINTKYLSAELDLAQGKCNADSLDALLAMQTFRKQRETRLPGWQLSETAMLTGLCRRLAGYKVDEAEKETLRRSAHELLAATSADPFSKSLAARELAQTH